MRLPAISALFLMILPGCTSLAASSPAHSPPIHRPSLCDTATAGRAPRAQGTLTPPRPGPLYGFWGLNGYTSPEGFADVEARYGITVFQVASSDPAWAVSTLLPMVKAAGMRITLRLTPDHEAYTDAKGNFDLVMWENALLPWYGSGVQGFVDDGTLVGHMLLDDIQNFDGRDPDAAELDEMARCSKTLFPGLMTYVREKASAMPPPDGGRYTWVDANVNQYEAAEGPVGTYASAQAGAARALGLGVIMGLNIADGGDGSSRKAGYRAKHWAMSPAEILADGRALASVPGVGMFLNWEYDAEEQWADGSIGATYFNQPPLQEALARLGAIVAANPAVPLLRP